MIVVIYENGEKYEIDSSLIYEPFPEPDTKSNDTNQPLIIKQE